MLRIPVLVLLLLSFTLTGRAERPSLPSGSIWKVLPHYLDQQGRHSRGPTLFARDAYQGELRKNPALQGGLRFDVHWKARHSANLPLVLRVEMCGSKQLGGPPLAVELPVRPGSWLSQWSSVELPSEVFQQLGTLVAWRVTLQVRDELLAEQRSFLWQP